MNSGDVAAFLARRGHRVIRTASCWWYNEYRQGHLLYAFPPHQLIDPDSREISEVFRQCPSTKAIRFIGPARGRGELSFIWTCSGRHDLSTLNREARRQTRRGLERCETRPMSWDDLIPLARRAHEDTLRRHGTDVNDRTTLGIDRGLGECAAYEAWGTFVNGDLAAYLVTLSLDSWAHFVIHRSVSSYLPDCPNYALYYNVIGELLARPGIEKACLGPDLLWPKESLDDFKRNLGCVQEPVRRRIVVAPWLRPVLSPPICRLVVNACQTRPGDRRLRQLAGFCRIIERG